MQYAKIIYKRISYIHIYIYIYIYIQKSAEYTFNKLDKKQQIIFTMHLQI